MSAVAPRGLGVWWRALRAYSFPASAVPVAVGAALALERGSANWALLPVVIVCSVLFQAATNVIDDYFDYERGVDEEDPDDESNGARGCLPEGCSRRGRSLYTGLGSSGRVSCSV